MRRVIGFVGSKSKTRYLNQINSSLFESDLIKREKKNNLNYLVGLNWFGSLLGYPNPTREYR